jgi:hypothetical protein
MCPFILSTMPPMIKLVSVLRHKVAEKEPCPSSCMLYHLGKFKNKQITTKEIARDLSTL